ncbi:MAG: 50S ribosomal protein L12 [archaeon]
MEYIYTVLLLKKANRDINEANIKSVLQAAGVRPDEAKIKALLASLADINIDEAIKEASITPIATAAKEHKEEKKVEHKEEKKPEEASAGLSSLFG